MTIKSANPSSVTKNKTRHFRPDIQGLRAIAVLLVLIYHGELGIFPGGYVGVDIFFVISGFLITGHLIRTAEKTGKIDLKDFYARRIRRILPAATVVLIFVALISVTLLPITRWEKIGVAIISSSIYLVNWYFAKNTDYLNSFSAATPIQHYWTLAVEEQFYIVWPIIILISLYLIRYKISKGQIQPSKQTHFIHKYIQLGAWGLTILSLVISIYLTATLPSISYFVTPTRIWELGIGAIIAAHTLKLENIKPLFGYICGVLGFTAIFLSSIFFDSTTAFPGFAALLPTLGAAGIIIGGMAGRGESGIGYLLKLPLMRWIGDLSYSLYLWHWPLIVLAKYWLGGEINAFQGLALIVLSFFPAWLSYKFVENPIRDWAPIKNSVNKALRFGVILMAISALAGVAVLALQSQLQSNPQRPQFVQYSNTNLQSQPESSPKLFGAQALSSSSKDALAWNPNEEFYPEPVDALMDRPRYYLSDCEKKPIDNLGNDCTFGNKESDYKVALVGDSHAGQWAPTLEPIAIENNWKFEIITKNSCPLIGVATIRNNEFDKPCNEWNKRVLAYLTGDNAPGHVIVSSSVYEAAKVAENNIETGTITDGYKNVWTKLKESGVEVTIILDIPRPEIDLPECVAGHLDNISNCDIPLDEALAASGASDQLNAARESNLPLIDMTKYICPNGVCSPVIGNVLVYRDGSHLTATYAESLAQSMGQELQTKSSLKFDPSI